MTEPRTSVDREASEMRIGRGAGPGRVMRVLRSLRARFFVLLALLAALAAAPWLVGSHAARALDGVAEELNRAGSLRYRLLAIERATRAAEESDAASRRLGQLFGEQRRTLVDLIAEGSVLSRGACSDPAVCERLKAHLTRWDRDLAPALAQAHSRRKVPAPLAKSVEDELTALDATVELLTQSSQARIEAATGLGRWATTVALALVGLVALGVGDVFSRIRRLRSAAGTGRESDLLTMARRGDEIASLARGLGLAARDARQHRAHDERRVSAVSEQQQALRAVVAELATWIAHAGSLDAALQHAARAGGYASAAFRAPGEDAPDGRTLRLTYRGLELGTLTLHEQSREDVSKAEHDALLDTLAQVFTIAAIARRALDERELRAQLAARIASEPSFMAATASAGDVLREAVPHERAVLEVRVDDDPEWVELDADGARAVDEQRRHTLSANPTTEVELRVDASRIGSLSLHRGSEPFRAQEEAILASVSSSLAAAMARMLLQARIKEREEWRTLGAFGRLLAHELRNPVNALALQLSLIERALGKMEPDTRNRLGQRLQLARSEMARLDALVTDYDDLVAAGAPPQTVVTDLAALVDAVTEQNADLLRRAEVELTVSTSPTLVEVDAPKIRLLVEHLIQNAVEAMQPVSPRRLELGLESSDDGVMLWVRDSGPGLSEPREIFRPGFSKKPGSTGMGLAICRRVAERHGGTLTARNVTPHGAELRLRLPASRQRA